MNAADELEAETKKPNGRIFLNSHRLIRLFQKQQKKKTKNAFHFPVEKLCKINKRKSVSHFLIVMCVLFNMVMRLAQAFEFIVAKL